MIFRCVNMIYFVSAKNQDCGRASPGGGGQDLLRQGLHHQAEVRGGEHRGGAARVHHLEEGEQDAQLRHREGRHQVNIGTTNHRSKAYYESSVWRILAFPLSAS